MSLIITKETLDKMDLCGNHHAQNAIKFVGELREITVGNVLCALEQGVDVFYFLDYWLREDAGKGLGIGPKGKIPNHLLWIHEELLEGLNAVYKQTSTGAEYYNPITAQVQRAVVFYQAFECLWINKRWAL